MADGFDSTIDISNIDKFLGAAFRPKGPQARESQQDFLVPADGGDEEEPPASFGRYAVAERIGAGGTGLVFRIADPDLGRELAIKVLRPRLRGVSEMERLFLEEARLCSRLQHPGVIPIHELGTLEDGSPYFTMKVVEGETLARILDRRALPQQSAHEFQEIFLKTCQTLAFAHERGVIHCDIKPQNIMVGAFGEVQVMDWGFARPAESAGAADEQRSQPRRIGGTPAYMAPEQARREAERITPRTDVFGLGALLCEILTGAPPFLGDSRSEIILRATRGWIEDAYARLDACGADPAVIALTRRCLAPEPADRPADAGEVARAVEAHLDAVEQRARALELEAAEARATAGQLRRNNRLTIALSAAISVCFLLAGATFLWIKLDRLARAAKVEPIISRAIEEGRVLQSRARRGEFELWDPALSTARKAEDLLDTPGLDPEWVARSRKVIEEIAREKAAAVHDRTLMLELQELKKRIDDSRDPRDREAGYAAAFRSIGIEVGSTDDETASAILSASGIQSTLMDALAEWMHLRRKNGIPTKEAWREVQALTRRCDRDPWRDEMREAYTDLDLPRIRKLLKDLESRTFPPETLDLFARILLWCGEREEALRVFRLGQVRYPEDFRITLNLANQLDPQDPEQREEAARLLWSAVALQPRSARALTDLGRVLLLQGDRMRATEVLERAAKLDPDWALTQELLRRAREKED